MRGIACVLGAVLAVTAAEVPLEYRFVEVRSTVRLRHDGVETKAAVGQTGVAGDEVRTGWRGRAVVAAAGRACRFEIFPSTRARLGGPEPGVLIVLDRGRLKAIFDALTGNQERLVETPGAVLAVRGTRYVVEVARDGNGVVAVFQGTVEVRPRTAGFAVTTVTTGETCRFGPRTPPRRSPLPRGVDEDDWRSGTGEPGAAQGTRGTQPAPGSGVPGPRPGSQGKRPGGGGLA